MDHNKKINVYIQLLYILSILMMLTPSIRVIAATKDNIDPIDRTPFFIVTALIGGTIILTLSYVSWKKYRAERKKKNQNNMS